MFWALTRVFSRMGDPAGVLETTDDIVGYAATLRAQPTVRSRGGLLYTADYEVCAAVLRSTDASADVPEARNLLEWILIGPQMPEDEVDPLLDAIIAKDGDEHARLRKLLLPAFTHRVMQSWRESTERIAHGLMDRFPARGPVDLVSQWAAPLPMAVICEILGVPFSDRDRFREWGNTLATGLDRPRSLGHARAMEAAARGLTAYLTDLLAARRRSPEEDLLSVLAAAEDEGNQLSDRDIIATASFLLIAGFETTVNLLGAGTLQLLEHRDQLARAAADHALIPGLVEEALRYCTPVQYTFRTALAPIDLPGGEVLKRGQTITLIIAGANRDDRVFEDPDRFDIMRENARRHLAFGYGPHMCLGASLARMEAEVAWRLLLERYPDTSAWRLAGEPVRSAGRIISGLQSLPVRLA